MWVITLLIALGCLSLGFLTLARNIYSSKHVYFFLLNIFTTIWVLSNFFESYVPYNYIKLFVDIDFISALLMAGFLLLFSISFVFERAKTNYFILLCALLMIIFQGLLIFSTNLIISGITMINPGLNVEAGKYYYLYGATLAIFVTIATLVFVKGYFTSEKVKKRQIQLMFFGLIVAAIILSTTNLLLPRLVDSPAMVTLVPQLGYLGLVVFLFISYYTIIKHRLMDIRLVVARSIAYTILLAILALFYAGSVLAIERLFFTDSFDSINLTQGAIRTILAVIMAFSFQPLRRWITRKTDRIFFKNAYDPQKLLDDLSHLMSSTIVLDALLVKVLEILISDMKISRGIFILFKEDYSLYKTQTSGYKDEPKIDMKDAVRLARNGTAVYDELDEDSQYKEPLRKFEASISLPLKTEKEIVGVLLLGEKNSGDMFNQQDLRILEIIAPEVSVAIENAKSYEEISRFNVTLKNEVKHATKRLEEKNAQLRELDQAKDEFISMASHQLRTPLTVIKGYLSMLLEGDVGKITKSQKEFINEAFDGSSRMVGLINDLLNVSRMDTGRFFIEPTEVDMEELVGQEVKELQKQAGDKGLYLKIEKTGKIPHVWVDETKIRQVVMNFIDNALYYTEKGGVTIKLEKVKDKVIYAVSDTGVGIPKAEQPKIFEKFFRAGNARKIRPDGTGLGIYLAKRVIEDHGGEIFFESTEGQGSTFGFRVPYRKHPMPEKDNHTPEPKILSVD